MNTEFAAERLTSGQVAIDLWSEHISGYTFAVWLGRWTRELDVARPSRHRVVETAAGNVSTEFAAERVIPVQVDMDLWNEHISGYSFAVRLVRWTRVLEVAGLIRNGLARAVRGNGGRG